MFGWMRQQGNSEEAEEDSARCGDVSPSRLFQSCNIGGKWFQPNSLVDMGARPWQYGSMAMTVDVVVLMVTAMAMEVTLAQRKAMQRVHHHHYYFVISIDFNE